MKEWRKKFLIVFLFYYNRQTFLNFESDVLEYMKIYIEFRIYLYHYECYLDSVIARNFWHNIGILKLIWMYYFGLKKPYWYAYDIVLNIVIILTWILIEFNCTISLIFTKIIDIVT